MAKQQKLFRCIILAVIAAFSCAAYVAFAFFFDVFKEAWAILLLPILSILPLFLSKKHISKVLFAVLICILTILSVAASTGVAVVATSVPDYGQKPSSGSVATYNYSESFMKQNYDINQKTQIKVWLPQNYSEDKKYPVLYLLDGDVNFNYASIIAANHSENGDGDMIVVGIGYGYWNSTFARGGIVWQDQKHLRGRWRDFYFADDTQIDYIGGVMGGKYKRGKQYTEFIENTVVADIRTRYSTDVNNSTLLGHSMGGSIAAYFLTQYDPAKGSDNPFTNFIIADNGFLEYNDLHFADVVAKLSENGNRAHTEINVYRLWGGVVSPSENYLQIEQYERIEQMNWQGVNNYIYIPDGANHSDTITISIDQAENLLLGMNFLYNKTNK